ncbi:excisionase family DNA binding protein [Paraburkholderia tropica]|uniref:helix-turn-helix domain-containing protein n=1 Tax=Paraburkholderia tropica TaxID=92647 RepID=UPI0015FFEEF7|nr:helix-turn-helix domain-containing protein [Paraburkholderia tropica]MBB2984824.1 excisionase family DNA binding protein [Paraburkholderia tropica]MBB3005025.1 excisionase family DNA binding protein [Paraburkholderia tropica]MBB6324347.1 excisionase family DNA binding protein [Paraburkholderia tropica]QNB17319.1 helix-turn-helix domain-containing protein [Paraburkholderia tropica]
MFHTVEDVAASLRIHPKTVLRFIREGKLRATRVGRAYRILNADLLEFVRIRPVSDAPRIVRVTSIVDIPEGSPSMQQYLSKSLHAMTLSRGSYHDPLRVDVAFDPVSSQIKIIIAATLGDTASLMSALETIVAQAET